MYGRSVNPVDHLLSITKDRQTQAVRNHDDLPLLLYSKLNLL
jgi:hypothetical protein